MVLEILVSVTVVSSIGTGLAALLSICDHFLANYGPCQININDERNITVKGGKDPGQALPPSCPCDSPQGKGSGARLWHLTNREEWSCGNRNFSLVHVLGTC